MQLVIHAFIFPHFDRLPSVQTYCTRPLPFINEKWVNAVIVSRSTTIANCTIISSKRKKIKEKYFKGICLRAMMFRSLFQGKKNICVWMFLKQNKKRLQCIIIRKVLSSTILLTAWFNYMYLIHQRRYGSKQNDRDEQSSSVIKHCSF